MNQKEKIQLTEQKNWQKPEISELNISETKLDTGEFSDGDGFAAEPQPS